MKQIKSEYVRRQLENLGVPMNGPMKRRQKQPKPVIPLEAHRLAQTYIKNVRRRYPGSASWFDVRDAYLAGFTNARTTAKETQMSDSAESLREAIDMAMRAQSGAEGET